MLRVPPVLGVPVPGLTAWNPDPVCDVDDVDDGAGPPVLDELLHAAASTVTATALTTAPKARKRKCLTTLLPPLRICSAKVIREGNR